MCANKGSNNNDIIKLVGKLFLSREKWIRREIISLDFDEGGHSCLEKLTVDVDRSYIKSIFAKSVYSHFYLPLEWREKGAIYSVDCVSADGRSLRLLNRSFNDEFAEWMFWWIAERSGYAKSRVPADVQQLVLDGIKAKSTEVDKLLEYIRSRKFPAESRRIWKKMQEVDMIEKFWNLILRSHIVVVRAPRDADCAIIKLSEKRSFRALTRSKLNIFSAVFCVNLSERPARLTKMKVPQDVRILRSVGIKGVDDDATLADMEIKGDGSWGVCYSYEIYEQTGATAWSILFVPRRTSLIVPGLITSWAALFATYIWNSRSLSIFSSGAEVFSHSVPFLVVLALAPTVASTILSHTSGSFLYRSMTRKYGFAMTLVTALVFIFPILPVDSYQWSPSDCSPDIVKIMYVWLRNNSRNIFLVILMFCSLAFSTSFLGASPMLSKILFGLKSFILRLRGFNQDELG